MLLWAGPARATGMEVMTEQYPPFSYEEHGVARGLCVDIVQRIMDAVGHKEPIHFYPWARAYMQILEDGPAVLFPMARSPERDRLFRYVGPIFTDTVYFYRLKGAVPDVTSLDDARRVSSIGVTRDDFYHSLLLSLGFANLDVSTSQTQDFAKLAQGRVVLVPMGQRVMPGFVGRVPGLDASMFERTGPAFYRSEVFIAFSKATPVAVIRRWQQALDRLKAEGVYRAILNRYFSIPDNKNPD
jgi:polar amino acid transport system substrate-binding protein